MTSTPALNEADMLAWLMAHPEFLHTHTEMLGALLSGTAENGTVVDFQAAMVGRLQQQARDARAERDSLIDAARVNHSRQAQIHHAVLACMQARSLEQLVEVLTTDLPYRMEMDVVRLGLETPMADAYEVHYHEQSYSGLCFVPMGSVDAMLNRKPALLLADTRRHTPEGFEMVFAECTGLVQSCALLAVPLARTQRMAVLALGSRNHGQFDPHHGSELLQFFAATLQLRLDALLQGSDLEEWLPETPE